MGRMFSCGSRDSAKGVNSSSMPRRSPKLTAAMSICALENCSLLSVSQKAASDDIMSASPLPHMLCEVSSTSMTGQCGMGLSVRHIIPYSTRSELTVAVFSL